MSTFSLGGLVKGDDKGLAGSLVEIIAGANVGQKATTDQEGRYRFGQLATGELTVRASADGYQSKTLTVQLDANTTTDFALTSELGPAPVRTRLSGLVTAVSSAGPAVPLPSARVAILNGSNRGRTATTDVSGRYELADLTPEPTTVEVSADGFASASTDVDLREDDTADFRLQRAAPEATVVLTGRVIDVLSLRGLPGLTVSGDALQTANSDATGAFRVTGGATSSGDRQIVVSGPGVIERRTSVQIPGSDLLVSLISATFDLAAFDQMFRDPGLRRWTAAPPLIIEQRAVQFTDINMADGLGVEVPMTAGETQDLVTDLSWALADLSGGTFTAFQRVTLRTSPLGSRVSLLNMGSITVARVVGLTDATGKWGWGRWLYDDGGVVTGGVVMIDASFDRAGGPYRRSLRAHELGHALGYAHVTARESVMNPSGRVEPTAFDRDATRIAFQRKPGNRAPDVDPATSRSTQSAGHARWSPAQH